MSEKKIGTKKNDKKYSEYKSYYVTKHFKDQRYR